MSNDEKILEILGQLQADMADVKQTQKQMQEEQKQIREEQKQMRDDITQIKLRLDLDMDKKLQLLAEGHELLLQTLAHKDRVEAVEDDIVLLKTAIKQLAQRNI